MKRRDELTPKQKLFIHEYLIDLNATQAAIRAGYSPKGAKDSGYENKHNPLIKAEIERIMQEKEDSLIAKEDEVLKYLTTVLRSESESEVIVIEGEGEGVSRARKVNKAPDEKERLKAAELLGKRYGAFTDKLDVEITPINIIDDVEE
ncbi:MAG: terminase small subunit [Clostridiales bacterium]|nr:terminase small subunit [Clostridiales bacterium]MDU1041584.1 terminase small subunit [Clostridiales bacterium]